MLPCLIFEDDHLLVVNKPAGLNTHAPSPYAGEGLFDWLRHREPRWASLAIIHRLDKETSGVIVFSKSQAANLSLTEQFTARSVRKKYLFLTDRAAPQRELTVISSLVRTGDRYVSRPLHTGAETAETHFTIPLAADVRRLTATSEFGLQASHLFPVMAEPRTGRTHQIRVHAADKGFPVLGDTLYGGAPAARVYLHAMELALKHPVSGKAMTFRAPFDLTANVRLQLRAALLDPEATTACRLLHGSGDGWPGFCVDRLGDYLLAQSAQPPTSVQRTELDRLAKMFSAHGVYHKRLTPQVRRTSAAQASPQLVLGESAPARFTVLENGLQFELSLSEGYSVGLFLDQRDNRRRLLTFHIASGFPLFPSPANSQAAILNTFSYTCGFSVCAAKAGAHTTSLDLSKKYLDWGKLNFRLNQIDPASHHFIQGDTFDWLRRLAKKQRSFDLILLDPPTFSQSKLSGTFRVEKDYGKLVTAALPLLKPGGVLFASTNAADWAPEEFLACLEGAIRSARRKILRRHYVPQPSDFPISRLEPAYLKTVWLGIE